VGREKGGVEILKHEDTGGVAGATGEAIASQIRRTGDSVITATIEGKGFREWSVTRLLSKEVKIPCIRIGIWKKILARRSWSSVYLDCSSILLMRNMGHK
jgi:hypothetical protein